LTISKISSSYNNNNDWNSSSSNKSNLFIASILLYSYFNLNKLSKCEEIDKDCGVSYELNETLSNWSSNHTIQPQRVYEPKTPLEIIRVLSMFNTKKGKIRPIGTFISPNGIASPASLSSSSSPCEYNNCTISLSSIDHVNVDAENQQVTVGAGAKVSTVLDELKKYNLTLENFSSIKEQQIGGWIQVAAHGTGCLLPTVDDMVIRMKLVTPSEGLITLSNSIQSELFKLARVSLGSLGVVSELTLKCIPCLNLLEQTWTTQRNSIGVGHYDRLKKFRHVRYMWIPLTPTVVVVVSDPTTEVSTKTSNTIQNNTNTSVSTKRIPTYAMCNLLLSLQPTMNKEYVYSLSVAQLRDLLLDISPLDMSHIRKVNHAESLYWQASNSDRIDDSTNILGFDCGGAQLVYEVCFNIGNLNDKSGKDIEFIQKLLILSEKYGIPCPSPIEQRWSARSTSPLSPAYSNDPDDVFTWVGIIMYLPPNQSKEERNKIADKFEEFKQILQPLLQEYKATVHWAKIELPNKNDKEYNIKLNNLKNMLSIRYNLNEFRTCKQALDPNNILSNELIDTLFDK
jgi:L-galactono-1,4-lactone dehydrogenase